MRKIFVCFLTIGLLLSGCFHKEVVDLSGEKAVVEQTKFDEFLKQEFTDTLAGSKISAHFSVEDLGAYGLEDMEVSLGTVEAYDFEALKTSISSIKNFNRDLLTENQKSYYDRYLWMLELNAEYEGLEDFAFIFSVNSGINANLITIFTEYVLRSEEDIQDLIVYLNETRSYFKECLAMTQKHVDKGIIQSDYAIDAIIDQCNRFLDAKENEIIKVVLNRIDDFEPLSYDKKQAYKKQVRDAVNTSVIPAYQDVVDYFTTLKGTQKNNGALCNWNDGKKYYEVLLKDNCSADITVKEAKKLLEDAIDDAIGTMIKIMQKNPSAYDELYYTLDMDANEALKDLQEKIQENYPKAADVKYIVDYLDPSIAGEYIVAYYLNPPVDNFRENVIRVNPSCTDLYSTLAHEGYPGHLYQTTYALEHNYHPIANVLNYIGYTEGWAVYVEMDSYNMIDVHLSKDAITLAQMNTYLSHYLVCLADIMVHYEGATVEEVEDYMYQYGMDGAYIYEVVLQEAGTYLPYGMGYLQMSALQRKAEKALGKKYQAKEFHEVLLNAGDCSYDYLEQQVDAYIKMKK